MLNRFLNSEVTDLQTVVDSLLDLPPDSNCSRPHKTLLLFRWNTRIVQIRFDLQTPYARSITTLGADDLKWIPG